MSKKESGRSNSSNNLQEEIQNLAYQYFLERGSQHGHDQEDWLRAESTVRSRHGLR